MNRDQPTLLSSLRSKWNQLPDDHPIRAMGVTALISIVAAIFVSTSVVYLRPIQQANIEQSRQELLASIVGTLPELKDVLTESGADALLSRWVNLDTGDISAEPPVENYDPVAATNDPQWSKAIEREDDIAGIARRALHAPVYLLEKQDELVLVVLPVYGVGYQSTIRAWLALSGDVSTVISFSIVDQAETPGLGSRIEDPDWLAQWKNRPVYSDSGEMSLKVAVGSAQIRNEIDGITGATRTGNGINNMLQYWLGEHGFGPFLSTIEEGTLQL